MQYLPQALEFYLAYRKPEIIEVVIIPFLPFCFYYLLTSVLVFDVN